jgi:hypothetical protein
MAMFRFLLVEQAVFMVQAVVLDSMVLMAEMVVCVLFGPARLVIFHQPTRGICNGSLYSNS